MQRAHAEELRLPARDLLFWQPIDVRDAIGMRFFAQGTELPELRFAGGDDQLAAAPVRHAVRGALFIEKMLALDAGARLKRAFRVIDAGVDDFRIARPGMRADRVFG